jgi:hypothetical protein
MPKKEERTAAVVEFLGRWSQRSSRPIPDPNLNGSASNTRVRDHLIDANAKDTGGKPIALGEVGSLHWKVGPNCKNAVEAFLGNKSAIWNLDFGPAVGAPAGEEGGGEEGRMGVVLARRGGSLRWQGRRRRRRQGFFC